LPLPAYLPPELATTDLRAFLGDRIAPVTVKGKGPKRKVTRSRARRGLRFRFSSDDPSASFECRLDKGEWKPCASPQRVRRAKLGRHTLRVRAGDARGNVEARPVHWRWKVVG